MLISGALRLWRSHKHDLVRALTATPAGAAAMNQLYAAWIGVRERRARIPPEEAKRRVREAAAARFAAFMTSGDRLAIPAEEAPTVSVILVLYNQAALTFACLESLARVASPGFETIVIDNASSDETTELLSRVDGVRARRMEDNLGFLRAVNLAAKEARGEHLLLLNNDAEVDPDAIARAAAAMEDATIGAVGGRIVLPDGTLQEAGSIVWNDGSCAGYLRGAAPETGEAMFARPVDYCSGAFILTRRDLWERLGGFDDRFAPAYYEETDYCLRVWEAGFKVWFDPTIRVRHLEFGSLKSREEAIARQARNRAVFAEKHAAALAGRAAPGRVIMGRRWPPPKTRALLIDDRPPIAALGGGLPRAAEILRQAAAHADETTHFSTTPERHDWAQIRAFAPATVEVIEGRGAHRLSSFLEDRRGVFTHVIVSRPHNFAYLKRAMADRLVGARIVYDAEAIFADREIARRAQAGKPLDAATAARMRQLELTLARAAATVLAVSDQDAEAFRHAGAGDVRILGHALRGDPAPPGPEGRSGLLFVGNLDVDKSPNVDALAWFVREVAPRLPSPNLLAAGSAKSRDAQALAGSFVTLAGLTPDLSPHYRGRRLFIAPTRFAAGVPHKVHEAAAAGLPVVATSLIARQLGWRHETELLVADDADAFADAIERLTSDDALWLTLQAGALQRVKRDCDPEAFAATIASLFA